MLLTNGHFVSQPLLPNKLTLIGLLTKNAFLFLKAFAKITVCGKVLCKCEKILISFKALLDKILLYFLHKLTLNKDKNCPPSKSKETFVFMSSKNLILFLPL